MLVSEVPALREYWYPVAYTTEVTAAPRPCQLFGERFVVWRRSDGGVAAAVDACPHRGAQLSKGWLEDGCLVCPYHGWRFDDAGACVAIPQTGPDVPVPGRARLVTVHAEERYELVWVCVAETPRAPIPDLPELDDPSYTLVHELMEVWPVCAPRVMDNALDVSHLSFVHRNTVGDASQPRMRDMTVERDGLRLSFSMTYTAKVTGQMVASADGGAGPSGAATTSRTTHGELVQPLVFRGVLVYETGLRHVLYKTAAPIDDGRTLFCQFIARNDDPDEERQRTIAELDRAVQAEDIALMDGLPADFPVEVTTEVHSKADRMTLEYRRVLAELAAEAGPLRPDATWDPLARPR